ncbi:Protein of unknown function [Pyronema omphalodes CBS 100304]|uniref:Uncharacterized protein n=1 Tax=Pyronema omphalodes (strain CBS 100304) TaxID=1076935 RepID=U4KY16_PYROM|nr:Protein of unknown function [Pyronema omphalodes CBS 100304]
MKFPFALLFTSAFVGTALATLNPDPKKGKHGSGSDDNTSSSSSSSSFAMEAGSLAMFGAAGTAVTMVAMMNF